MLRGSVRLRALRYHASIPRSRFISTIWTAHCRGGTISSEMNSDIQLSFIGELASARFGIARYPNITAWIKRFQARPACKAALARGGAISCRIVPGRADFRLWHKCEVYRPRAAMSEGSSGHCAGRPIWYRMIPRSDRNRPPRTGRNNDSCLRLGTNRRRRPSTKPFRPSKPLQLAQNRFCRDAALASPAGNEALSFRTPHIRASAHCPGHSVAEPP